MTHINPWAFPILQTQGLTEWRIIGDPIGEILKARFRKKEVDIEIEENPELISGIFVRYKDRIYDYSVKGQLRRLEHNLTV